MECYQYKRIPSNQVNIKRIIIVISRMFIYFFFMDFKSQSGGAWLFYD